MGGKPLIFSDIARPSSKINIKIDKWLAFIWLIHNDSYYRTLFYYRIGPIRALLISWLSPGDKYFSISYSTVIGSAVNFYHPYATIINADRIGDNIQIVHCTTIGATSSGRPKLGNNVTIGANATVIGDISIGDNVIIGAGSVVVKDVPDNCVVAGNPAKIIRYLNNG